MKKKIVQKTIHESDVSIVVKDILDHISSGGDQALLEFAKKFDNWEGKIEVSSDIIQNANNLVNKNVKPFSIVVGVPAKQIGWMSIYGERIALPLNGLGQWECPKTGIMYTLNGEIMSCI